MILAGLVRSRPDPFSTGTRRILFSRLLLFCFVFVLFFCRAHRFQIENSGPCCRNQIIFGAWSFHRFVFLLIGPSNGHFMCRSIDYESIRLLGPSAVPFSCFCFVLRRVRNGRKQVASFSTELREGNKIFPMMNM